MGEMAEFDFDSIDPDDIGYYEPGDWHPFANCKGISLLEIKNEKVCNELDAAFESLLDHLYTKAGGKEEGSYVEIDLSEAFCIMYKLLGWDHKKPPIGKFNTLKRYDRWGRREMFNCFFESPEKWRFNLERETDWVLPQLPLTELYIKQNKYRNKKKQL